MPFRPRGNRPAPPPPGVKVTASLAILEQLAAENRRVLSDWRAALLLRRATETIPADRRRWEKPPASLAEVHAHLRQMQLRGELAPLDVQPALRLYEVTVPYASGTSLAEDEVLMEAHPYAALGYLSAFAFHGLSDEVPKEILAIAPAEGTGGLLPPGTHREDWQGLALAHGSLVRRILRRPVTWYRLDPRRYFGTGEYRPRGYPVRVTTPERTLLDGLLRPELCGGIEVVLRAWARERDTLDLDSLVLNVDQFEIGVLRQRVGFILDELRLAHRALDRWQAEAKRGGSSKLVASAPYAPTFSERWSLSLNAPLMALREGRA